jgi:hypothetical protein
LVFPELERELLAELDELIYQEHLATMTALYGNEFNEERQVARRVYNRRGRRRMPWLRWRPEKTIVDLWGDAQKRHENPEYRAQIAKLQAALDADARKIATAVEEELKLRKAAEAYSEQQQAAAKRSVGRRYVPSVHRRRRGLR